MSKNQKNTVAIPTPVLTDVANQANELKEGAIKMASEAISAAKETASSIKDSATATAKVAVEKSAKVASAIKESAVSTGNKLGSASMQTARTLPAITIGNVTDVSAKALDITTEVTKIAEVGTIGLAETTVNLIRGVENVLQVGKGLLDNATQATDQIANKEPITFDKELHAKNAKAVVNSFASAGGSAAKGIMSMLSKGLTIVEKTAKGGKEVLDRNGNLFSNVAKSYTFGDEPRK